mgnify:CR=1 FL=1
MAQATTLSLTKGKLSGTGDSAVWASVQPRLESYIQQELAKLPTSLVSRKRRRRRLCATPLRRSTCRRPS